MISSGEELTILSGFVSDGASIPWYLWWLISPNIDSRTLFQSVVHDWLFANKLGFWKSNWWYFKELKPGLSLFTRCLILLGLTLFRLDTL